MKSQVRHEKKVGMLVKGKAASKPENMRHNERVMVRAGDDKRRAEGTAYGEVGMAKRAERRERAGEHRHHEMKSRHESQQQRHHRLEKHSRRPEHDSRARAHGG